MRLPFCLSLVAAMTFAVAAAPSFAQDSRTFVVNDDGGYGLSDCFSQGVACGQPLANSLCASRGHGPATAFGLASDITATIPVADSARLDPNAIVITCGD
jgi:hypothetical protein